MTDLGKLLDDYRLEVPGGRMNTTTSYIIGYLLEREANWYRKKYEAECARAERAEAKLARVRECCETLKHARYRPAVRAVLDALEEP